MRKAVQEVQIILCIIEVTCRELIIYLLIQHVEGESEGGCTVQSLAGVWVQSLPASSIISFSYKAMVHLSFAKEKSDVNGMKTVVNQSSKTNFTLNYTPKRI